MNPLTRLSLYLVFSISTLLSKEITLLFLHILAGLIILFIERHHWDEWKKKSAPYWKYFPITGAIFFLISFLFSEKALNEILFDITSATVRLIIMVSMMTIYIVKARSYDIINSVRSLWYKINIKWRWVDDFFLFFEMTIRFYTTIQDEWRKCERSQMAISTVAPKSLMKKAIRIAHFIPDFIVLNLIKADTITSVMIMRGYGRSIPRSIYPLIGFPILDLLWFILGTSILCGVHIFVKI